jgi:tRNA dimethylallyltransferase
MAATSPPRLVVVIGPTGAGKTRLSLDLAERVGGEIINSDSQQVYLGMDIGTGKVGAADRARVRHHLLDVVRPDEDMTAARFVELADSAIRDCAGRGRPIIVCGGTGLYVRALLLGLFDGPGGDPEIRARLQAEAADTGTAALHARLVAVDPALESRIDRNDLKRIVRALEVYELTGEPMSVHQQRHDHRALPRRYPARLIGLAPDRDQLYRQIDARVDAMMADGLLAEVAALRASGYLPPLRSQQAIGYAELHAHLEGRLDLDRALELVKRNSRRYARRQISWYRPDPTVTWADTPAAVDLGALSEYLAGR